jgi:prepilin-type N-terminal cleavage/methylation domain-containing protein/prepilin-type processing-associated H-X9-DG protein
MKNTLRQLKGFTFIELVVVIALLAILGAMIIPALAQDKSRQSRINCVDNLKRIGVAVKVWANDHGNRYPMRVDSANGGPYHQTVFAVAPYGAQYMFEVFGIMSNALGTPRVLVCPTDERSAHADFVMSAAGAAPAASTVPGVYFNNFEISYALAKDASEVNPRMLLTADRNIYGSATTTVLPSQVTQNGGYGNGPGSAYAMGTNFTPAATAPAWTQKMHQSQGNVGMVDGSVQQLTSSRLRDQFKSSGDTSSTPNSPGPNTLLFP